MNLPAGFCQTSVKIPFHALNVKASEWRHLRNACAPRVFVQGDKDTTMIAERLTLITAGKKTFLHLKSQLQSHVIK